MLEQAVRARVLLSEKGISAAVINFPWLNRIDVEWLKKNISPYKLIVTLDNHYTKLGQGDMIASALARVSRDRSALAKFSKHTQIISFGVEEIPVCGQNTEVLKYHKLDADSLAQRTYENYIHI